MTIPGLTDEQLQLRRKGITATDVSAVIGENPYKSATALWEEKRGVAPQFADNLRMKVGRACEGAVAALYADANRDVFLGNPLATILKPGQEGPLHLCTPDRLVFDSEDLDGPVVGGLECKTVSETQKRRWPADSDEIPNGYRHYYLQCLWSCGVMGLPWWDLAVLIGFDDFRVYRVETNPELLDFLYEEADVFWQNSIVGGKAPLPDGSDSTRDVIHRLFPRHREDAPYLQVLGGSELEQQMGKLKASRAERDKWAELVQEAENRLKGAIGSAPGAESSIYGRVSWKLSKGSEKTDYRAALEQIAGEFDLPQARLDEVLKDQTSMGKGSRRFTVPRSWKAERE